MLPRAGQLHAATIYAQRVAVIRRLLGDAAVQAYNEADDYEQADLDAFLDKVVPLSLTAQRAVAGSLAGYLYVASGEYPEEPLDLDSVTGDAIRPEMGLRGQWQIPWWSMWGALGAGVARAVAVDQTRDLVRTQAITDLSFTQTATLAALAPGLPGIVGFRRVTAGNGCDFCNLVSEQRYHVSDLMPVHPGCNCSVAPIIQGDDGQDMDPGAELNEQTAGGEPPAPPEPAPEPPAPEPPAPEPPAPEEPSRAETVPFEGFKPNTMSQPQEVEVRAALDESLDGIRPEVGNELQAIRLADPANPVDAQVQSNAMAWYLRDTPTSGDMAHEIHIKNSTFWTTTTPKVEEGIRAGWFAQAQPESGLQYVVTHEMGHFLTDQMTYDQQRRLTDVLFDTARALKDSGIEPVVGDRDYAPGRFISRYATTNHHEAVAEAWAEYKLSPEPGPLAQAVGDAILEMLGK